MNVTKSKATVSTITRATLTCLVLEKPLTSAQYISLLNVWAERQGGCIGTAQTAADAGRQPDVMQYTYTMWRAEKRIAPRCAL